MGGEIIYGLDGPRLRKVLMEVLGRSGTELPTEGDESDTQELADGEAAIERETAPAGTAS